MLTHRTTARKFRITIDDTTEAKNVAIYTHDDRLIAAFYPVKGETLHEVESRAMRWIDDNL